MVYLRGWRWGHLEKRFEKKWSRLVKKAKMERKYLVLVSALEPILWGKKPQTTEAQTKTPGRHKIRDSFWFMVGLFFFYAEEACAVCFSVPSACPAVVWDAPVGAGAERRCPAGAAGGAAGRGHPPQMAALEGSARGRRAGPAAGAFLQNTVCPAARTRMSFQEVQCKLPRPDIHCWGRHNWGRIW